jgi:DNA-binding NtrC family response regulator
MNQKTKLLVVDDEQDILDLLKGELTEGDPNFEVFLADSGYKALSFVQTNDIDLIITDIAMPDMDGFELFTNVKELRPALPIIIMTGFGYDPNHTVVNAKKAGLKNVIFKPFDIPKLMKMIYEALENENN